jgi:hypothetical protein
MKRIFFFILILLVMVAVAASLTARARAPSWLKEKILTGLTKSCPKCKAELDSVEVSFIEGRIVLHDFEFVDTPEHSSQVAVKAHLITIDFDPRAYMDGLILIRHVGGEDVNFTLIEDARIKPEPDDDSPPFSQLPEMVVQSVEVSESSFRYLHKMSPHDASLQLTKIHGSLGSWVTRPELEKKYAPERTSMAAWGVLEHSGTFEVRSKFEALSKEGTIELDVAVENQELAAVNGFFVHECGLGLEGLIIKVATHFDMRNGKIDGNLRASYTGLKIRIENPKNSGVKNFIETVGAKIVIAGEQGVNGKPEGLKAYRDERKPGQSLFSAMFHALGGAAKELVK